MTWISFSQLRALSERYVKAAALHTINSQTVTQITCHPYQSLHIELLYLLPAGSPLYLGNITMDLFGVSAQNLTIPTVSKAYGAPSHHLFHTVTAQVLCPLHCRKSVCHF